MLLWVDTTTMSKILVTLQDIQVRLTNIEKMEKKIMATEQQLLDVIKRIDEATTKQGVVLKAEGDTLQKVSDEVDSLIAQIKAGQVNDSTLNALQAQADKIQSISDSLDKQAEFSNNIASKVDNPVPVPVPNPS